jgi:hypothetical protein
MDTNESRNPLERVGDVWLSWITALKRGADEMGLVKNNWH